MLLLVYLVLLVQEEDKVPLELQVLLVLVVVKVLQVLKVQ